MRCLMERVDITIKIPVFKTLLKSNSSQERIRPRRVDFAYVYVRCDSSINIYIYIYDWGLGAQVPPPPSHPQWYGTPSGGPGGPLQGALQ